MTPYSCASSVKHEAPSLAMLQSNSWSCQNSCEPGCQRLLRATYRSRGETDRSGVSGEGGAWA